MYINEESNTTLQSLDVPPLFVTSDDSQVPLTSPKWRSENVAGRLLLLNFAAPLLFLLPRWRHYSISPEPLPPYNEMQRDVRTIEEFNSISCLLSSKRVQLIGIDDDYSSQIGRCLLWAPRTFLALKFFLNTLNGPIKKRKISFRLIDTLGATAEQCARWTTQKAENIKRPKNCTKYLHKMAICSTLPLNVQFHLHWNFMQLLQ